MSIICGHRFPEGHRCHGLRGDHVHDLDQPCPNGAAYRHHAFVADPDQVRRQVEYLEDDLRTIAPVLSRRKRVALRKALLIP